MQKNFKNFQKSGLIWLTMVDTICYYGCNKGGSMADKNVKVPKKRENNLVRCLFKDELDRYSKITKRDRSAIMLLAWEHFKTTDFYKRDMLGLKVK